jgi:RecA-family ATPase
MKNSLILSENESRSGEENSHETIVRRLDSLLIPKDTYFIARPFTKVIEDGNSEPDRRSICGGFVYENTITYFFSRTNYGKSIFAFQLAYAAATGTGVDNCLALRNECEPMKVLLFDLENDAKTISERHGLAAELTDPALMDNLVYMHENAGAISIGFELLDRIEQCAVDRQAKLIIIDNISRLLPDSLKADLATMVIKRLQQIREQTGAAVLVIGHTTKGDPRTAVSPVSYYGSAMLQNFFTEMFYLDTTKDGRFFLCHAKTKREERYTTVVPAFTRGEHPVVGLGFTFEALQNLADIQLPFSLEPSKSQ